MSSSTTILLQSCSINRAFLANEVYTTQAINIAPYASICVYYQTQQNCTITISQEPTETIQTGNDYIKNVVAETSNFAIPCTGLYLTLKVTNSTTPQTIILYMLGSKLRTINETINANITGPITLNEAVEVSNFPATQNVTVGNFPATQPVSGNISVSNFPASQNVSVSNFPATQAVSGNINVSNFPASQNVSVGNFPATQAVSGTINVGNFPASQNVSVSNFPATQAISGTINVGNFPTSQNIALNNLGIEAPLSLDAEGNLKISPMAYNGTNSEQLTSENGKLKTSLYAESDSLGLKPLICDNLGNLYTKTTGLTEVKNENNDFQITTLPILTGTDDGTTQRKLKTDANGNLNVNVLNNTISFTQNEEIQAASIATGDLVGIKCSPSGILATGTRWSMENFGASLIKFTANGTDYDFTTAQTGIVLMSFTAWLGAGLSPGSVWLQIYKSGTADVPLISVPLDVTPQNHVPMPLYITDTLKYKLTTDYNNSTPVPSGANHHVYVQFLTSYA